MFLYETGLLATISEKDIFDKYSSAISFDDTLYVLIGSIL